MVDPVKATVSVTYRSSTIGSVRATVGAHAPKSVSSAARDLADRAHVILSVLMNQTIAPAHSKASVVSVVDQRPVSMLSRADQDPLDNVLQRPRRLFVVSHDRRVMGAMFIEEIGPGGVYLQTDLNPRDCFLLDTGRRDTGLMVWVGAETTYKAIALAVRTTRSYIRRLNAQLAIEKSPVWIQGLAGSGAVREVEDTEVRYEYSGRESPAFIDQFRWWVSDYCPVTVTPVAINLTSLSKDEAEDELLLDDGSQKPEPKEKGPYRSSVSVAKVSTVDKIAAAPDRSAPSALEQKRLEIINKHKSSRYHELVGELKLCR